MIESIYIQNYKIFQSFELKCNSDINILVGDNEVGKSTILEAINLALTKKLNGRLIDYELSPFLFNQTTTAKYIQAIQEGKNPEPPNIVIELYLSGDNPLWASFRGNNNSKVQDICGIKLEICFDENYRQEYAQLISEHRDQMYAIPIEYYKVIWLSFDNNFITTRGMPLNVSFTDSATIRLQNGADYYLQDIIKTSLDVKERVGLNISYRQLKESFCHLSSITTINNKLSEKARSMSDKQLSIAMDLSPRSGWETHILPHLDEIPFHLSGQGEQNTLKIMLSLNKQAQGADIILIEEPENHLSFSSMTKLLRKIATACDGKQVFITTHSTYVLNKLGIGRLILLNNSRSMIFNDLPADTQNYFMKLSGYDTLRLIIAKKAILVEGPSDELILQKAYFMKYNKMPIDDGIDIINVRGLSFERFLEIAISIHKNVSVVTDNDGDFKKHIVRKYKKYDEYEFIHIYYSDDDTLPTLEPQLLASNSLDIFNQIFGTQYTSIKDMTQYMEDNKTDCALQLFETSYPINFPEYINNAIS